MDTNARQRGLFFNNLLILGFDKNAVEKEHRITCDKDMFCLPNQKMFEIVTYFLFGKLNEVTKQEYIVPWPLLDRDQHRQFQKTCVNHLTSIAQESNIKFPRIVPSVLSTFSGERFYELYLAFSTHVVEKSIRKNNNVSLIQKPYVAHHNSENIIETLKILTISSVEKLKEIQLFSYKHFELFLKIANNFITLVQKLKSSLSSDSSLLREKNRALISLFPEDAKKRDKTPLEKSISEIMIYKKKIKKLWKQLEEFLTKESKLWNDLSSAVEENPEIFVLEGEHLKISIDDNIKDFCPELNEICSLKTTEDDQICLLKFLKVYSIFLKFYVNTVLKGDLSQIQELLSVERKWNFKSSLEELTLLNEKLFANVIPNLKESNKNTKDELFIREFSEDLQTFTLECSSWNFSSEDSLEKIKNARSSLSNNVTDEVLKKNLLACGYLLKNETLKADIISSPDPLESYSDIPKTLCKEHVPSTTEFNELNVSLTSTFQECDDLIHSLKQMKLKRQNLFGKDEFEAENSLLSDVFIPTAQNDSEKSASIPLAFEATELVFDVDIDYHKPFKMRESWLLEESLNSVTLPETSFLD
ncbi:HAUS6_N domain-containing protein [Trichonephila clavata]|uniref:HAUS6_N domain-containing protein n=1 Tax=Trichonephila clavata TaxID=2740835 RepID=A0A8X6JDL5_TRICU|nr:HAUS6_N domain-containing protein [Trichonephila clavata]